MGSSSVRVMATSYLGTDEVGYELFAIIGDVPTTGSNKIVTLINKLN